MEKPRMQPPNAEDALAFIVGRLKREPSAFAKSGRPCDLQVPEAILDFCREPGLTVQPAFQKPFYDAAWQLCRMGVLRPGVHAARVVSASIHYQGVGRSAVVPDEYCLTAAGEDWLRRAPDMYFPTDPGRYVRALEAAAKKLGSGFTQRAHEAAKCYETGAYLACCAMCGAAAESALLAVALGKTGKEQEVLRKYGGRSGRREVVSMIFKPPDTPLRSRFETAFNLLSYWRDDAAHGKASTISELEAYDALGRLLRLASFVCDNWAALTSGSLPP